MKNELSGMKAFVTVAELGSFSKAAEQLSLSTPATLLPILHAVRTNHAKTCAYPGRKNTAPQGQSVDFQS